MMMMMMMAMMVMIMVMMVVAMMVVVMMLIDYDNATSSTDNEQEESQALSNTRSGTGILLGQGGLQKPAPCLSHPLARMSPAELDVRWWERQAPVLILRVPAHLCPSPTDTLIVPAFLSFSFQPGGPEILGCFQHPQPQPHCWHWVSVAEGPSQAWLGHIAEEAAHRQPFLKPQLPQLCNYHLIPGLLGRARNTEVHIGQSML